MRITLLIIFCLAGFTLKSQKIEIGLHHGPTVIATHGYSIIDSVSIDANSKRMKEINLAGFIVTYNHSKYLEGILELNAFYSYHSLKVSDLKEDCQFCPVNKAMLQVNTNLDIFMGPKLSLGLLKDFDTEIFAGPNLYLIFPKEGEQVYLSNANAQSEAIINNISDNLNRSSFSFSYGGMISYKSFYLTAKYTRRVVLSDHYEILSSNWDFNNYYRLLQIKLGYKMLSKK